MSFELPNYDEWKTYTPDQYAPDAAPLRERRVVKLPCVLAKRDSGTTTIETCDSRGGKVVVAILPVDVVCDLARQRMQDENCSLIFDVCGPDNFDIEDCRLSFIVAGRPRSVEIDGELYAYICDELSDTVCDLCGDEMS